MSGRDFTQNPGPTNIPDRILRAMSRPAVDFGTPEFLALLDGCLLDVRDAFGCSGRIVGYTSSGHGSWEATIVNLFDVGDRVVVCDTGMFAHRWGEMAEAHGCEVEWLATGVRRGVRAEELREILQRDVDGTIRGVLVAHTETSTGVTSDIAAMREVLDDLEHPALLVVDAIASFATAPIDMDAGGIDVGLAASQKGLMMPVGLSFSALSDRAVARAYECERPRYYWDWRIRLEEEGYRKFCGTPPIHHLFGLREALDLIAEEGGIDAVVERHRRMADAVRVAVASWAADGSVGFNAELPSERADAVTCVGVDPSVDSAKIVSIGRERFNVTLGSGLGELAGRAFRIGHLGDLNVPMVLGAIGATEAALRHCGVPVGAGGLQAATELLAR